MLVHITLNLDAAELVTQEDAILEQLRLVGVQEINAKFLRSYGLVSGYVDAPVLEAIETLGIVRSVEPEGAVWAFQNEP